MECWHEADEGAEGCADHGRVDEFPESEDGLLDEVGQAVEVGGGGVVRVVAGASGATRGAVGKEGGFFVFALGFLFLVLETLVFGLVVVLVFFAFGCLDVL